MRLGARRNEVLYVVKERPSAGRPCLGARRIPSETVFRRLDVRVQATGHGAPVPGQRSSGQASRQAAQVANSSCGIEVAVAQCVALPRRIVRGLRYMLTRRCAQRGFRLRPSDLTTQSFAYALALAMAKTRVEVHAICVMSNHVHLIVTDVEGRLPEFMRELNRPAAKALNASQGPWENLWAAEPYNQVALPTEAELLDKVAYVAANPAWWRVRALGRASSSGCRPKVPWRSRMCTSARRRPTSRHGASRRPAACAGPTRRGVRASRVACSRASTRRARRSRGTAESSSGGKARHRPALRGSYAGHVLANGADVSRVPAGLPQGARCLARRRP